MENNRFESSGPDHPKAKIGSNGVVIPQELKWHGKVAAAATYSAARLLVLSWRTEFRNESSILSSTGESPAIFCIWHNRLALCMVAYHQFVRRNRPAKGLAALISASKDGGLLARILQYFQVQPVRGSSSRRGPQALLELSTWLEKGYHVAITPDGPRGPCYKVQSGAISLAQITGAPIIPVSTFSRNKLSFRSWDRFQLPLPFSHCDITFGREFTVPREVSDQEKEGFRLELESRMKAITRD